MMVTEEEHKLLAEESIHLPVDMPLTKVCIIMFVYVIICIIDTCIIVG